MKTALIAGATGLVGRTCLSLLLANSTYAKVVAVGRRPLELTHPKLEPRLVSFDALAQEPMIAADDAFCALGTTMRQAGSKEAFHAVDHDAVVNFAYWARGGGASTLCVVSSVGADPDSGNFYLATKGKMETGVREQYFERLHVFRPGLLIGDRKEARASERAAAAALAILNPLLMGSLRKYRSIPAEAVAKAMVAAAQDPVKGSWLHHSPEMERLAATD
jgi:uncharacterized protein YbjT (DUF2867 family)